MPNYRYNTPDYMRQNNSNGCHVGGSRTMPASVSQSTPSRSCCNIHEHDKLRGSQLLWPMFRGRNGVLFMKLKKDSDVELFLRN